MSQGFEPQDLIQNLRNARGSLLKHLDGLTDEQVDWKPYPECKSIRETLQHLVVDDLAAIDSLKSGKEPEYETYKVEETDYQALLARMTEARSELESVLADVLKGKSFGDEVCIFGWKMKVGAGVPMLASEDNYHAGQIAYIRMATDPAWNYYAAVYGG